uniref:Uncharacterized protein n=1 Tax=Trichinella nativa TaxID=6335 RepID=A0A0V1KHJ2_9BILA
MKFTGKWMELENIIDPKVRNTQDSIHRPKKKESLRRRKTKMLQCFLEG